LVKRSKKEPEEKLLETPKSNKLGTEEEGGPNENGSPRLASRGGRKETIQQVEGGKTALLNRRTKKGTA